MGTIKSRRFCREIYWRAVNACTRSALSPRPVTASTVRWGKAPSRYQSFRGLASGSAFERFFARNYQREAPPCRSARLSRVVSDGATVGWRSVEARQPPHC